jgi:hypothetical protein
LLGRVVPRDLRIARCQGWRISYVAFGGEVSFVFFSYIYPLGMNDFQPDSNNNKKSSELDISGSNSRDCGEIAFENGGNIKRKIGFRKNDDDGTRLD